MATVMLLVKLVTVFPRASCAATLTAGVMERPAIVVTGCTVKPSWVATPAVITKVALVPELKPLEVAVSL
jgi:hypothetical protein